MITLIIAADHNEYAHVCGELGMPRGRAIDPETLAPLETRYVNAPEVLFSRLMSPDDTVVIYTRRSMDRRDFEEIMTYIESRGIEPAVYEEEPMMGRYEGFHFYDEAAEIAAGALAKRGCHGCSLLRYFRRSRLLLTPTADPQYLQ
jgi:hypothetical protein